MDRSRAAVSFDVINLILGAFLFLSPWMFAFASGAERWNAWVCGLVIALFSIAALAAFAEWEEWLNLVVGLWVIISPWLFTFSADIIATRTYVIVGAVVLVLAAIEIWMAHQAPPRTQTR